MINNINKKIFKTLFLILTIIINIEPCLAVTTTTTNHSSIDDKTDYWIENSGTYRDGLKKINYTFKYKIEVSKKITLKMYNMNNESVIPDDIRINKDIHKFKAGTWAGISISETQTSTWTIDLKSFKYTEERIAGNCIYEATKRKMCTGYKEFEKGQTKCEAGEQVEINGKRMCEYSYDCGEIKMSQTKPVEYDRYIGLMCKSSFDVGEDKYFLIDSQKASDQESLMTEIIKSNSNDKNFQFEQDKKTYDIGDNYKIEIEGYTNGKVIGGKIYEELENGNKIQVYDIINPIGATYPEYEYDDYEGSYGAKVLKQKEVDRIKTLAREKLGNSTAKIRYIKVNDYDIYENECKDNRTDSDLCYGIIEGISKEGIKETQTVTTENEIYGSYYIDYDFMEEKVCINAKTSEVTYGRECNENEIKVANGKVYDEDLDREVAYWHYFIPLNTKSDDDFWLEVIKNEQNTFDKEECISVIKDKPDSYEYYITPLGENQTFKGDYDEVVEKSKSHDIKLLNKTKDGEAACSLSMRVNFPISQEFYNETTNKEGIKKFKGFNFYYKPININNPFPNGLTNTSIWKEWYDTVKSGQIATPNISKSFNEVTYMATNINTAKVRNYTKNNPYTSWKNISLGGRSSFIENENIVIRNEGVTFYKLGCGPNNLDWSECKQ